MRDPPFDDVARRYKEEEAARKAHLNDSMKTALASLRNDAVRKVIVEYDGHDDDGFVKRATLITTDGKRSEVGERELSHAMFQPKEPGSSTLVNPPTSPLGVIADFVMQVLESEAAGWENNEGGFGTCVVDVETGEYDLNHVWGYGKPYEPREA